MSHFSVENVIESFWFDVKKFEQFTKGFVEQMHDTITPKEIELLPISALIMTYECGIRFLADYINGDVYFKVHYDSHNLDRARTQFKLVADIENKLDELANIVKNIFNMSRENIKRRCFICDNSVVCVLFSSL